MSLFCRLNAIYLCGEGQQVTVAHEPLTPYLNFLDMRPQRMDMMEDLGNLLKAVKQNLPRLDALYGRFADDPTAFQAVTAPYPILDKSRSVLVIRLGQLRSALRWSLLVMMTAKGAWQRRAFCVQFNRCY